MPFNSSPIAISVDGPHTLQVLQIAVFDDFGAIVTEGHTKEEFPVYTTTDFQNWVFRLLLPHKPLAILPQNRLYWSDGGGVSYIDALAGALPQHLSFPSAGAPSGLIPNDDGFLAVAQTNIIYSVNQAGVWAQYAVAPDAEKLVSLAKTPTGVCAIAANTGKVWSIPTPMATPNAVSLVTPAFGAPRQMTANQQHTYVLTDRFLLEGNTSCADWKSVPLPLGAGTLRSVAAGASEVYLATQMGLLQFDGTTWTSFPGYQTRSMVHRLRYIDGRLYACHLGGIDESSNYGETWVASGLPIDGDDDVSDLIKYDGAIYAATDRGLFSQSSSQSAWASIPLPAYAPKQIRGIASDGSHLLLMGNGSADQRKYAALYAAGDLGQWKSAMSGLDDPRTVQELASISGKVYATTVKGLLFFDFGSSKWNLENIGANSKSLRIIVPYGLTGTLVTDIDNEIWTNTNSSMKGTAWQSTLDTTSIKGYYLLDAWSNPTTKNEIFLATIGQLLYAKDGRIFSSVNQTAYGAAHSFASIPVNGREYLFEGTDSGVWFIDRTGADNGPLEAWKNFYTVHSGDFWFWPVTVVASAVTAYAVAVMCMLILMYLPLRGLIASRWLMSLISTPLAVSPKLGRWILFFGYLKRLRGRLSYQTKGVNLDDYYLAPIGAAAQITPVQQSILGQIDKCLDDQKIIVIEHALLPELPMVLASLHGTKGSKGTFAFDAVPLLITLQSFDGSVVSTGTRVLRDLYGVPINSDDLLVGQLENGDIVFYLEQLGSYGDELQPLVSSVTELLNAERYKGCRFIAFCLGELAVSWSPKLSLSERAARASTE